MVVTDIFGKAQLFRNLTPEENQAFSGCFQSGQFESGQVVFQEGEMGDTLYVVEKGTVSLKKQITGDIQKKIFSAQAGLIFGEFSFMDRGERSASAIAETATSLISIARKDFDAFARRSPAAGTKVLNNLLTIIVGRLRRTNDSYRDAIRWGLEITGTDKLNFQYLISESPDVRVELSTGKTLEGKVIQLEKSDAGYEVVIVNKMGKVAIIPYHAIVTVMTTS